MLPAWVFRQIARPSFCYLLLTSSLHPRLDFRTAKTNFCQAYPTQCLASKAAMTTDTGSATPQQYTYRWPRPSVTVDLLIFTVEASKVWVLLIQRKAEPFQGSWALPGGFVDENEALEVAAGRELQEETGVEDLALAQVGAFGEPGRDPRGHTITVAYMAFAPGRECGVRAGDDASDARWFAVDSLPPLAFDHKKILESAWGRLLVVPSTEGDGGHVAIERGSGKVLTTLSKPEHAEALAATKPAQM